MPSGSESVMGVLLEVVAIAGKVTLPSVSAAVRPAITALLRD